MSQRSYDQMMTLETSNSEEFGVVVLQRFRGWVVVQRFDDDAMQFTGYSAIARRFIKHLRKASSFINRAITTGIVESPVPLEREFLSFRDLLSYFEAQNLLILVYREEMFADELLAGLVELDGEGSISLTTIGSDARWESEIKISVGQLTRVDFGGPYENTLHEVAGAGQAKPTTYP